MSKNNCVFSMGDIITQAKMCALQSFLNVNDNGKKLPQEYIETLIRLNTPTYGYLMVARLGEKATSTSVGVYASGFNTNGSFQINYQSDPSLVSFPYIIESGTGIATSSNQILPSYILFTSSGSLTVSNVANGQYLNVILVGGGGGGGGGGGKPYLSDKNGGGGGGGGAGYSTQGTITSNGTFTITVGKGGEGGAGGGYSGRKAGNGSNSPGGGSTYVSGPYGFQLSVKGGGGGYGGLAAGDKQQDTGGNGGKGGNGGGGRGSGEGTVGNGGSGQKIEPSETFGKYLYIGGGGGGGNNTSTRSTFGETAGNPQGQYLFDKFGPYWGQGGGDPGTGSGISAAGVQNGTGNVGEPSNYWSFVGGGGGGGAGNNGNSADGAGGGGGGGAGANGCVLVWWNNTLNAT